MADSAKLTRLRTQLTNVQAGIARYESGTFEIKRGERSFSMPSLSVLYRRESVLLRAIARCDGSGGLRQGVARERYRFREYTY